MYELGKYIISLKEEMRRLCYVMQTAVNISESSFNRTGREGLIGGESVTGGSIGDVSTFCFKLAVCACQCIRFLSPPTVLPCSELAEPRLSMSRHGFFRLVTNWRE
jgi:hypothetical protein